MHMMHADIGRNPAQHGREVVERTTVQRCVVHFPLGITVPACGLELMLHIEQPYAHRSGDHRDRQLHEQERLNPNEPHQRGNDDRCRGIGCHCANPRHRAVAHKSDRQAMLQQKQMGRTQHKQDKGVTVCTIFKPAPK